MQISLGVHTRLSAVDTLRTTGFEVGRPTSSRLEEENDIAGKPGIERQVLGEMQVGLLIAVARIFLMYRPSTSTETSQLFSCWRRSLGAMSWAHLHLSEVRTPRCR